MKRAGEKLLLLHNREGKSLSVLLREYREGDEEQMIECIREEYGETYFKTRFYKPEYLRAEAASGHITFLVAQALPEEEIVGMMILKQFFPGETMCEIASQIFRRKCRGYGLAEAFFTYGMELLQTRVCSAAYCLPVMFHNVTQRLLYRQGLRAAGLILNVFDMERISHSYPRDRNEKHSQGIQIMALGKKDAGTVYIPEAHREFCRRIYTGLGVDFQMAEAGSRPLSGQTGMLCLCDDRQKSLEIRIDAPGADLQRQMQQIHAQYPLCGKQTSNVFLNCSHKGALKAYEILRDMGYFFTGLKPLCSEREYMVLHHPGQIRIYFEDYIVNEEFKGLLEYVSNCQKNSL